VGVLALGDRADPRAGRVCLLGARPGAVGRVQAGQGAEEERHPEPWTFMAHPDVPPTNHRAKRVLRPFVIWRKLSLHTPRPSGAICSSSAS
jgi:hypothetical protein